TDSIDRAGLMRVEQRVVGPNGHLRLNRRRRERDTDLARQRRVDLDTSVVRREPRLVDRDPILTKRQSFGDRQAIGPGVELLGNVVGLAYQRHAALNCKSDGVTHDDAQLSTGALTELTGSNKQGSHERQHATNSLSRRTSRVKSPRTGND